jgi:hypothetical protein
MKTSEVSAVYKLGRVHVLKFLYALISLLMAAYDRSRVWRSYTSYNNEHKNIDSYVLLTQHEVSYNIKFCAAK